MAALNILKVLKYKKTDRYLTFCRRNLKKCVSVSSSFKFWYFIDNSSNVEDNWKKELIYTTILFAISYPSCSGARAPGLAADMHFRDDVIAFIGPACMFALEPVARLAAYWNTPIITGMGDQVFVYRTHQIKENENNNVCSHLPRACWPLRPEFSVGFKDGTKTNRR